VTKKDFELIAAALKAARVTDGGVIAGKAIYNNGVDNAAHRIADALATTNPRFDRVRFLAACGVQS
jgi:hypothetical protein